MSTPSRVIFATSTDWAWPAKLARVFQDGGIGVAAISDATSPLRDAVGADHAHTLQHASPLRSLARAIEAERADAIIPCDDRLVWHLTRLYEHAERVSRDPERIRVCIRRSLGEAVTRPELQSRIALLDLARDEGVRVPASMALASRSDLPAWAARHGFPAFLKMDGAVGGLGVIEIADLAAARRAMSGTAWTVRLAKDLAKFLLRRDRWTVWDRVKQRGRAISIQSAIAGRPANILVCSDRGNIIASTCVEVRTTRFRNGPAVTVELVHSPEMNEAALRIVRRLGASGLLGFDFMIENATGHAYLIEMNPRATQTSILATDFGRDPVEAYCDAILHTRTAPRPAMRNRVISLVPGAANPVQAA